MKVETGWPEMKVETYTFRKNFVTSEPEQNFETTNPCTMSGMVDSDKMSV